MPIFNEQFTASIFESEGHVHINGQNIPYKTVCQDNVFYNEDGKAIGSIFSYTYLRSDVADAEKRPVAFIFNGGPGSGSLWLHVGIFGPQRLIYNGNPEGINMSGSLDYQLINNDLCMLDICDLVFIDPVGTGYGRLLDKDAAERFYGYEEDANAVATFIHMWMSKFGRWHSPHYLIGESYGTLRAALLAEVLTGNGKDDFSLTQIDGLVLIGNAIGKTNDILSYQAEPALLALPCMAATHWYHHLQDKCTVEEFVEESYDFCAKEYAAALYMGSVLPKDRFDAIAEKLVYFTGLDMDYIVESELRPDMKEFMRRVVRKEGLEVGLYDSRFTLPLNKNGGGFNDDPAIVQYAPSYMAAICGPVSKALGITFERKYLGISGSVGEKWKRSAKRSPAECLDASMRRCPKMKLMFSSGMYDLICQMGQARYLATHLHLDMSRVTIREHQSGHMSYLGEDSAKRLADDVRAMIAE